MNKADQILNHLKIVELASVLAGPAVGQFFSELGAEVIKVENARTGGDVTRSWKLPSEDAGKEDSAYYRAVNWRKQVVALDLRKSKDRETVYALIDQADVVISNFSPAKGKSLGVDGATLRARNPRLIFARLDAFGPKSDRPAYDIVLQAETGFLSMSGTEAGELCRMPVALIDILAAHQLKEGILLALLQRAETGQGATVTTNLYASGLASLANQATNYLIAGHIPQPMGVRHPNIAPYGDLFELANGVRIVLAVGSDRQFEALCQMLGLELHPDWETNAKRVMNRSKLIEKLGDMLKLWSWPDFERAANRARIPFGRVRNMGEVFATAQAQAQLLQYENGDRSVRTVAFEISN
ncbi:MAG: CoA transferase [Bacteroidota bacterium]